MSIELYWAPEALHLIARDDGIGFDVAAALQGASLGLLGIRERVALVGGEFDCKSVLGGGTEVHAFFPLGPGRTIRNRDCEDDSRFASR